MTVRLLNSLPSCFLPSEGKALQLRGVSLDVARTLLEEGFVSHIGHESTAQVLSSILGMEVEFRRFPAPLPEESNDVYVIASFPMPHRLPEGERLTQEEILEISPRWTVVDGQGGVAT